MKRFGFFDSIRGMVLLSMIVYHTCWDLVYIFGYNWQWYERNPAYIWQQSICWIFIMLSGFCWSFGKKPQKRGLLVFGAGAVITLVTCVFMPEDRVVFGVLTCIGSCMLLMILLEKLLRKIQWPLGLLFSAGLFAITRNINEGCLGFEGWKWVKLPVELYNGSLMTYLGFPEAAFYSTDYFSLFPWIFLFLTGYFIYRMLKQELSEEFWDKYFTKECKPLSWLGRRSFIIYVLHQPAVYGILLLLHAGRG